MTTLTDRLADQILNSKPEIQLSTGKVNRDQLSWLIAQNSGLNGLISAVQAIPREQRSDALQSALMKAR